jgi:hypothetical protein
LSQPDMEREMVSPPAGAYIPSFTICHVLPDLPEPCEAPSPALLRSRVFCYLLRLTHVEGQNKNKSTPKDIVLLLSC